MTPEERAAIQTHRVKLRACYATALIVGTILWASTGDAQIYDDDLRAPRKYTAATAPAPEPSVCDRVPPEFRPLYCSRLQSDEQPRTAVERPRREPKDRRVKDRDPKCEWRARNRQDWINDGRKKSTGKHWDPARQEKNRQDYRDCKGCGKDKRGKDKRGRKAK